MINFGFSTHSPTSFAMFEFVFWNARGAGSEQFNSAIVDLVKINSVDILAICEPKVQFHKASNTLHAVSWLQRL